MVEFGEQIEREYWVGGKKTWYEGGQKGNLV